MRIRIENLMEVNGLKAMINTPPALQGEGVHGLPPHSPCPCHVVDEYAASPDTWMHGSDKASSYFVPVEARKGMWFDFTQNTYHNHHVAVVMSVQGVNPVNGQKVVALNLEQYKKQCPLHKIDFKQDRFCEKCKYKWPAQNYISTTTGESLWLDGFRNENGEVRQYIITEEESRGVAAQMIGNDRVFAIGFAFYLSKEPKPPQPKQVLRSQSFGFASSGVIGDCSSSSDAQYGSDDLECSDDLEYSSAVPCSSGPSGQSASSSLRSRSISRKKLEVGAGAKIQQDVGVDPKDIDFWNEEPTGMIYVNYVSQEECNRILSEGKREEATDGFMEGLKVGN